MLSKRNSLARLSQQLAVHRTSCYKEQSKNQGLLSALFGLANPMIVKRP